MTMLDGWLVVERDCCYLMHCRYVDDMNGGETKRNKTGVCIAGIQCTAGLEFIAARARSVESLRTEVCGWAATVLC